MGVNSKILGFLETSKEEFQDDVLNRAGLTLVEFHRHNCEACIEFEPMLEQLADFNMHRWVMVRQVVTGMEGDYFAEKYGFQGEPSIGLFVDGRYLGAHTGNAAQFSYLIQCLNTILQRATQADPSLLLKLTGAHFVESGPSQLRVLREATMP